MFVCLPVNMKALAASLSLLALLQVCPTNKACSSCPSHYFLCGQKCVCVPKSWLCDGEEDCQDGSDEQDCSSHTCPQTYFTCDNGHCIQAKWVCDGDDDCGDHSDEISCPQRNCSTGELHCKNGNCVPNEWRCDGDDDCEDSTDEECPLQDCKPGQFQCPDGSCIALMWKCDAEIDCSNGSDETECGHKQPLCTKGEFHCSRSLKCIRQEFLCDDENDCGDWEDEMGCGHCQQGEFNCTSGVCVNQSWRCDGDYDCDDQSDEANCTLLPCTAEQFQCDSGFCLDKKMRCDGRKDCADNSDERGCKRKKCRTDQFRCNDGKCLGLHKICNGRKECQDGSDEVNCGHFLSSCAEDNGQCEHNCKATPHGARCWCQSGYRLLEDRKSCADINECMLDGTCSQICRNSEGSFQCSCVVGYRLKPDRRGCKAQGGEAYLIFANRVDIRRVTPHKTEYTSILQGLQNAIALDFHHEKALVFWSDVTLDVIKRAHLNGTSVMDIVSGGLENPGGLAVDWVHDKLFWTDAGTSRIEVSNLDGSYRKVILWQNLEKPRAIAAHPRQGMIFWTDWGTIPKIERAGMDGRLRMVLANTSLFWPNGLTVDYAAERLYWADAKRHVIECANLDGSHRRTVISEGLPHPFALTMFEDELYWTDWYTKSINKANKFSGHQVETIRSSLFFPMDIHTFHPQRQPPAENKCGPENGGCSHLCLPHESGYSCSCPTGLILQQDRKHCAQVLDTFVLFSTQSDMRRISLDAGQLTDVVIPLSGVDSAIGVEFDSGTDSIFWSDIGADRIGQASWDGSHEQVIVATSLDSPSGIAFDWVARVLYWTDSGNDRIEACSVDTHLRTILVWRDLDHPRDIVVHPEKRSLRSHGQFNSSRRVTSILVKRPIWINSSCGERVSLGGSIIWLPVPPVNSLWSHGQFNSSRRVTSILVKRPIWINSSCGERVSLGGSIIWLPVPPVVISAGLHHPFGVTVFGQSVYWTDWDTGAIHYADKDTGANPGVLASGFGHIMDLKVFHRNRSSVATPCGRNNGGCSHICLLSPSPPGYACACPTGLLLTTDNKQCQTEMRNFLIFTRRQDIRKISLEVEYFFDVVIPVQDLKHAIAIDVDTLEGKMYWTDTVLDRISRADLNGSHLETVLQHGIHTADGLAVDSVGRTIYWTDIGHHCIQAATLDGSIRTVLIYENLEKPRAIALHYDRGYMFWTDWGKNARIERADMDGNNRKVIISDAIVWPNGLTIDRPTNRIIWADARTELIECSDLSGQARRQLVSKVQHPYGLTVAGNFIYWTDWRGSSIHRANKNLVSDVIQIRDNLPGIMDIHAVQIDGVEIHVNRCGKNNGGCSHLCLPNPGGTSCACPTGILLTGDGKTCHQAPSQYLLFAARGSIRRISLDTPDYTDVYLPLTDLHNVIALDFDYQDNVVYYTDVYLDVIRRASLNGSQWMEDIILTELTTTDGLAVDWIARNLYWTDSGRDVIQVSHLDGTSRRTIINNLLSEPRAIAVFPRKGLMFWTDWGEKPKIERAYLDGSTRKVIIDRQLGYPNALSIDYDTLRLYWVDAKMDKIETSDLTGRNRLTLIQQTPHPFGLTVFEDYIYWTDWQTEKLERASKLDGSQRVTIQSKLEGLMDVHMVSAQRQTDVTSISDGGYNNLKSQYIATAGECSVVYSSVPLFRLRAQCTASSATGTNNCSVNNGGCTHLCLARPDGFVCACPDVEDNKPCQTIVSRTGQDRSSVADINPTQVCSDEDQAVGICEDVQSEQTPQDTDGDHQQQTSAYIVVAVTLSVLLSLASAVAFFFWKRHRRQKYNVEEFTALTYANPTYQKASTETINADNRLGRHDAHVRYNTSDARSTAIIDSFANATETVALVHPHASTMVASKTESGLRSASFKPQVADRAHNKAITHLSEVSYTPVVT